MKPRKNSYITAAVKPRVKKAVKPRSAYAAPPFSVGPNTNFLEYIQMVEKKAYELYEQRGCANGRDLEDWFKAEDLIEKELCKK